MINSSFAGTRSDVSDRIHPASIALLASVCLSAAGPLPVSQWLKSDSGSGGRKPFVQGWTHTHTRTIAESETGTKQSCEASRQPSRPQNIVYSCWMAAARTNLTPCQVLVETAASLSGIRSMVHSTAMSCPCFPCTSVAGKSRLL